MNNSLCIKNLLDNHGIPYQEFPNYLKCSAIWRGGDSISSVTIYFDGLVIDHVLGEKFNYETLIGKITGINDKEKLKQYLSSNNIDLIKDSTEIQEPIIKGQKFKNKDFLLRLDKSDAAQSYWINRGISLEVLKELGGGQYKNKYYFPIFNKSGDLLGWSTRNLDKNPDKKYIIGGEKKNFVYPAFVCFQDIISSKEVYIHEGVPDMATLMTLGVRNNLVLFGTEISFAIINFLLRIPDIKIYLVQNNDKLNKHGFRPGEHACEKNKKKLLRYFDYNQVKIKSLPLEFKDINVFYLDKGKQEVLKWLNNL